MPGGLGLRYLWEPDFVFSPSIKARRASTGAGEGEEKRGKEREKETPRQFRREKGAPFRHRRLVSSSRERESDFAAGRRSRRDRDNNAAWNPRG
jgi:hypothetical protein